MNISLSIHRLLIKDGNGYQASKEVRGIAIISHNNAALSTDSRYFLEAEKSLDPKYWTLLKQNVKGYKTWKQFALDEAAADFDFKSIAIDAKLINLVDGLEIQQKCNSSGLRFIPMFNNNLIDKIWINKPPLSNSKVIQLSNKLTGKSATLKINQIRKELQKENVDGIIITNLDEIAWVLNLRNELPGGDFEFTPIFFSYLIITSNAIQFYIHDFKLTSSVEKYLEGLDPNFMIKSYSDFWIDIDLMSQNLDKTFLISKNVSLGLVLKLDVLNHRFSDIVEFQKSIKTEPEMKNMKLSQLKDAIAIIRYLSWLEVKLTVDKTVINEYQGALKLHYYRSLMRSFTAESFETISASGANAASNHYEPTAENNSLIDPKKIYLLDSGAQYLGEGTTDITRTLHFGSGNHGPSKFEKNAYTSVLKLHIAIASAEFPKLTDAVTLDGIARLPLWKAGLDYRHGTGHGVGSYLSVHEGPNYFGRKGVLFYPGQITSIEPGYYKDYKFGVRLESEVMVINCTTKDLNNDPFLKFEYLTLVPFCNNLIDWSLLNDEEIFWLKSYNKHLRKTLIPYLMKFNDVRASKWLFKETEKFLE